MVRWPNPKNLTLPRIKAARLAVARARHSVKPPDKKRTAWETGELYWGRFATLAINGAAILVAGFGLYILWVSVTQKVISIAPISVPKDLADSGFTADVAAHRLEDALNDIVTRAPSVREGPDVARQADLPSIVVPSTSLSTEAIAAQIRRFFRFESRSNVSGEVTIEDEKLWLRLRKNGRDLYASVAGVDPNHPDDLFAPAAQKIFEGTDPYLLGTDLIDSDPSKSLELARRIISDRPKTDSDVPWAHTLIGRILLAQNRSEEAIIEFKTAIDLDPRAAMHHNNLCFALITQHKYEAGIAECRTALKLDSRFALPYSNLGNALLGQGKTDEAIAEYKKAIEIDPRDAEAHIGLGIALHDQHKIDDAIVAYKKTIEIDPRNALAHTNLGNALRDQQKTEEAIAEYRKAIDIDPRYALAYRNLSITLRQQGKSEAADAEEKKALDLEQKP